MFYFKLEEVFSPANGDSRLARQRPARRQRFAPPHRSFLTRRLVARNRAARSTMLSSLPLQIMLYFNGWYDAIFTAVMLVLFIWKGSSLPYPGELGGLLALEVCLVVLLAIIEWARIFLASRGNKTERGTPLAMSIFLSFPAAYLFFYYLFQQVYVTRLDLILAAIGLGFIGLEMVISLPVFITFSRAQSAAGA